MLFRLGDVVACDQRTVLAVQVSRDELVRFSGELSVDLSEPEDPTG